MNIPYHTLKVTIKSLHDIVYEFHNTQLILYSVIIMIGQLENHAPFSGGGGGGGGGGGVTCENKPLYYQFQ